MTVLKIPREWLNAAHDLDFELEVVGRRVNGDVIAADASGTLLVQCRIKNAENVRLTADAVKALERRIADILAEAARRAHEQKRQDVNGSDLTA